MWLSLSCVMADLTYVFSLQRVENDPSDAEVVTGIVTPK